MTLPWRIMQYANILRKEGDKVVGGSTRAKILLQKTKIPTP
jgi:hypothetical protein